MDRKKPLYIVPVTGQPHHHQPHHRSSLDTDSSSSSSGGGSRILYWILFIVILVVLFIVVIGIVLVYVVLSQELKYADAEASKPSLSAESKVPPELVKIELRTPPETTAAKNNIIRAASNKGGKIIFSQEPPRGTDSSGKVRSRRQALLTSGFNPAEGKLNPEMLSRGRAEAEMKERPRTECRKRVLPLCARTVPFNTFLNTTTYPNLIGDQNEYEARRSLPFFNLIARSGCNRRLKQLLCVLLEPPCHDGRPLPPCKKFCRVALEGCAEHIPATLELSSVFDCRQYPDSTDPHSCVNLAIGRTCAHDEYQCPDKSCIPKHWLCDGVRDCIFAADETNCTNSVNHYQQSACSSDEFQCDGKCVPMTWRCDGDRDCLDGSDEQNCAYKPSCGPDRFKCHDGFGCIPKRWVCDGKAECRDGSDEVNCEQRECSSGDYKCDNGICIPNSWVCDGQNDCKDNSDERSCSATGSQPGGSHSQVPNPIDESKQQQQPSPVFIQTGVVDSLELERGPIQNNGFPPRQNIGPYMVNNNIYRYFH